MHAIVAVQVFLQASGGGLRFQRAPVVLDGAPLSAVVWNCALSSVSTRSTTAMSWSILPQKLPRRRREALSPLNSAWRYRGDSAFRRARRRGAPDSDRRRAPRASPRWRR